MIVAELSDKFDSLEARKCVSEVKANGYVGVLPEFIEKAQSAVIHI